MSRRKTSISRVLGDLLRAETRANTVHKIRRRAGKELGGRLKGGATGAGTAADRPDAWYVTEWTRLAGAVVGREVAPANAAAASALTREAIADATRQKAQARLAEAIAEGKALEQAVIDSIAALCDGQEYMPAWSLAEGVKGLPGGATASVIGHVVLRHRRRQFERAWRLASQLDDAVLAQHIPVEAVDGALATGSPEARARAHAIAAPTAVMTPATLVDLAGRFIAYGDRVQTAALVAELRGRPTLGLDDRRRHVWTQLERWLAPTTPNVPAGAVPVAIIDYGTPDPILTSGNVGDYVQTLALLGNLSRFSDVAFTGEDGLGDVATGLQARIPAPLRVTGAGTGGAAHLLPVDRDFSSAGSFPDGTWMLAFGWHMHPLFDLRYDFPYHPTLRPIFVSFHVNRLDMLSPDALEYLRAHGPIGCRDWNTVYLLLSAGVDAFFSGCLTTTVDALFPARTTAHKGGGPVGVIDLPARAAGADAGEVRVYSHQSDEYRFMSAAEGIRAADTMLAGYQRDLRWAVTGRLHAYLPLTALGVPVEFRTSNRGDVRFAGLMGFRPGDPRLAEIQTGIRELVAAAFGKIVSGAPADEVYAHWRTLTAARVAEAKTRFDAPATETLTTLDVAAAVAASRSGSRRFGPHDAVDEATVTDIVLAFDQNLTYAAAVTIESIVTNASGPLRLWILARGLTDGYQEWLASAFPALPITFLPCDRISYDGGPQKRRIPNRITVSTMDRLILPHLLETVHRVVYLDVDTLVVGDICELARTDLGGHPVGARDSVVSETSEWQRAGRPLEEAEATEMRRSLGRLHGFGHPALNAGVLVMDLDRMRADNFTARYLGLGERYGFHDQDTMLAYVGPARAVLDPRWNSLPVQEDVSDPKLIHWASFPKPWDTAKAYEQELWQGYAARLRARAGAVPDTRAIEGSRPGTLDNPLQLGPASAPVAADVERVIAAVRAENLSYLTEESLRTLAWAMADIQAAGVPGLIVEAGTARGGSAIVLAAAKSAERRLHLFDMFGMIPPPGEKDGKDVHKRYATIVKGASKGIGGETYYGYRDDLLGEVTASFARHGLPMDQHGVEPHRGLFEDTITLDEPVAFAHLDGDWYASTMTCLTRLAPLLAVGGRIVLDDYDTWSGCRTAVHEYFAGRPGYRFERRGRLHVVRV